MEKTGYLIGKTCFVTKQQATDHLLSQVAPAVTADGTLIHPIRDSNGNWTINHQTITPTFPPCNPTAELAQGIQVGWAIVMIMITAWAFSMIIKMTWELVK